VTDTIVTTVIRNTIKGTRHDRRRSCNEPGINVYRGKCVIFDRRRRRRRRCAYVCIRLIPTADRVSDFKLFVDAARGQKHAV
jgi:hypothetical protein